MGVILAGASLPAEGRMRSRWEVGGWGDGGGLELLRRPGFGDIGAPPPHGSERPQALLVPSAVAGGAHDVLASRSRRLTSEASPPSPPSPPAQIPARRPAGSCPFSTSDYVAAAAHAHRIRAAFLCKPAGGTVRRARRQLGAVGRMNTRAAGAGCLPRCRSADPLRRDPPRVQRATRATAHSNEAAVCARQARLWLMYGNGLR